MKKKLNIKCNEEDLKLFKKSMVDLLNIMKKYEFCHTFYEELNSMAFDIEDVLKNNLTENN